MKRIVSLLICILLVLSLLPASALADDSVPPAEEPVAEEPVTEEPVTEEPPAEEPVTEEPPVEEPPVEEPENVNPSLLPQSLVPVTTVTVTAAGGQTAIAGRNTLQLSAEVLPGDADNAAVTWSSLNEAVATVDQTGLVTSHSAGAVTIRATAQDGSGIYGEIALTVTAVSVASIEVSAFSNKVTETVEGARVTHVEMAPEETVQMTVEVLPLTAFNRTVTWSSSVPGVATVDAGTGEVTGVATGTTVVTATSAEDSAITDSMEVRVVIPPTAKEEMLDTVWEYGGMYFMEEDMTIDAGEHLGINYESSLEIAADCTLTIKSGAIVENYGNISIYDGTLIIESGVTFTNNGCICDGGTLTIGAPGDITGDGIICAMNYVIDEAGLLRVLRYNGLAYAQRAEQIFLADSFELSENITIPVGTTALIQNNGTTITVPSGVTLTNNGVLQIEDGATLDIQEGATFTNTGTIYEYGTILRNGTINDSGVTNIDTDNIQTFAALANAITAGLSPLTVTGPITLESSVTVPSTTQLWLEAALTVPSGKRLTNNGHTYLLESGGALTVQPGGTLVNWTADMDIRAEIKVTGGSLSVATGATYTNRNGYVKFDADGGGSVSGVNKALIDYSVSADSDADLRAAAAECADYGEATLMIPVGASIALTAGLTVADNTVLYIGDETGAAAGLTVPNGVELTNNGAISVQAVGALTVAGGGLFCSYGDFETYGTFVNNGRTEVRGGTFRAYTGSSVTVTPGSVDYYADTGATLSGLDYTAVIFLYAADSDTTLGAALTQCAARSYYDCRLETTDDFTLAGDKTVPACAKLEVTGALRIPSGATLYNDGSLHVASGGTLEIQADGRLVNRARFTVDANGTFTNNGTLEGGVTTVDSTAVSSMAELTAALTDGAESIEVTGSFALNAGVSIPADTELIISGATTVLSVPSGKTLTVNGTLKLLGGTLSVSGGTLSVAIGGSLTDNGSLAIGTGATVAVSGSFTLGTNGEVSLTDPTASVTGIAHSNISIIQTVTTEATLRAAMAFTDYKAVRCDIGENIDLTADLTVPANATVQVLGGYTLGIPVDANKTLNCAGKLTVDAEAGLAVDEGGTLRIHAGGVVVNNGQLYFNNAMFIVDEGGTFTDNNEAYYYAYSYAQIVAAIEAGLTYICVADGSVTLEDDLTVPANVILELDGGTPSLTVPSGKTLTNNGTINVYKGSLTVSGTYVRGTDGLVFQIYGTTVTGIEAIDICLDCYVDSEAALQTCLALTGYGILSVIVVDNISLTDDLTVPNEVMLDIGTGSLGITARLTVPSGKTFVNNGQICICTDGALYVEVGGRLTDNGDIVAEGSFINNGETTVNVSSYAELVAAIESGAADIYITGSITLEDNVTVPADVMLNLDDDAGSLTVPRSKMLTVDGYLWLNAGTVTVAYGGKLQNNGSVDVDGSGKLTVASGATYAEGAEGWLMQTYGSTVTGINKNRIALYYNADTETKMKTGLALSSAGYRTLDVTVTDDFSLTANLTVPANVTLNIGYSRGQGVQLTVPEGKTLINNGSIQVGNTGTLYVEAGGCLTNKGDMSVEGSYTNDGTEDGDGWLTRSRDVGTLEQLLAAASADPVLDAININGDIELTQDVEFPAGPEINLFSALTVADGATLTVNGSLYIHGDLTVASGGTLRNNGYIAVYFDCSLTMQGSYSNGVNAMIDQHEGSTVTGVDKGDMEYSVYVRDESALRTGIAQKEEGYGSVWLGVDSSITVTSDLTVPETVTIMLFVDENGTKSLTVTNNATLRNEGEIQVYAPNKLVINAGASLITAGDGVVTADPGCVVNNGERSGRFHINLWNGAVASDLQKAITDGADVITVWGDMTLNRSVTIPNNVWLELEQGASLTVARYYTLTNNGVLWVYDGAALNVLGSYKGNPADVYAAGSISPESIPHRKEGVYVGDVTVTGQYGDKAALNLSTLFTAVVSPSNAWDPQVEWSVENGTGAATVDGNTGALTGTAEGTVTVKATAVDGSGAFGTATVTVVPWSIAISAPNDQTVLTSGKTLKLAAAYIPSTMTAGAFIWSVRAGDEAYVSIGSTGLVTAKAVTEAHEVQLIAASTEAGPANGTYTLTIVPRATAVVLYDGEGAEIGRTGTAVRQLPDVDMQSAPTMQLSALTEPADASNGVTWKTSSAAIAAVDASGLVTFRRPGVVTVTATAADGTAKYASVKLSCYYLDKATRLTSGSVIPAIGLETGCTADMLVYGTDKSTQMNADLFTYSIPAAQQQYATVDSATGEITAVKAGSVTVTAALTGDPLGRKATLAVKVIPVQTSRVLLIPNMPDTLADVVMYDADGNVTDNPALAYSCAVLFNKSALGTGRDTYSFTIDPSAWNTRDEEITGPSLTYTSSDTSIASVAVARDGTVTVSVKKTATATGACTITGKTKDLAKVEGFLSVYVRDYAPRLGTNRLTLNPKLTAGVSTSLLASYGNTVETVELLAYNTRTKACSEAPLDIDFENDMLTITPKEAGLTNRTVTAMLKATCDDGETYELPMTVTVRNAEPAFTVRQAARFNLFYSDSEALITVAAKGAEVTGIRAETEQTFKVTYNNDGSTATVAYADAPVYTSRGAAYTSVALLINVEGYTNPVRKVFTVSTVTTAPSLALTPASSLINTALSIDRSAVLTVYDKTNKRTLALDENSVDYPAIAANAFATLTPDYTADELTLTLTGTTGGTATLNVQNDNWLKPVKLTHRVTVQTAAPTAKLGTGTLKLNSVYTEGTAATTLTLNQANQVIDDVTVTRTGTAAVQAEAAKIDVAFSDGTVTARFVDEDAPAKAGTYSFTLTPSLTDGTALRPVTLRVTVAATVPRVTLTPSALRLNNAFAGEETASGALKLSLKGYTVTGRRVVKNNRLDDDAVIFSLVNGCLTAQLAEAVPNGSYSYTLYPTVKDDALNQEKELAGVRFTVVAYRSTAVSAAVSAAGKLDAVNPDSKILYALTRLTNITGTATDVALGGADADKFTVTLMSAPNARGQQQAMLEMKDGVTYATNVTYKLRLAFTLAGITTPVETPLLSVRVYQSALKLAVAPANAPVFQSQSNSAVVRYTLTLTSPAGATLDSVTLNAATLIMLRRALGADGVQTVISGDKRSAVISVTLSDTSKLRAGSTYTLIMDVTPEGSASNVKPTQARLTLKAYK